MITFEIEGTPAPQGSKTAVVIAGRARLLEAASASGRERHRSWRTAVAQAARDVASHDDVPAPLDGPIAVSLVFRFRMPASRPARLRHAGVAWHTTKPDSDKLARACLDALVEGGLLRDDARVCSLSVRKAELRDGWTGAIVSIDRLGHEDAA